MPPTAEPSSDAPQAQLARLMDGYLITQLLYVAAKLSIADLLADGPRDGEDLARAVGVEPDELHRLLRGLAAEGVLVEYPAGRFGLTPLGDCLRAEVPGSLRGAIVTRGDLYYRAAGDLLDAVRDGVVAFDRAYGSSLFAYLSQAPDRAAEFQASMADRSRQEVAAVVASYDFRAVNRLVDVGGGTGVLLAAILAAAPHLRGVLFDQTQAVAQAEPRLRDPGLADRCEVVAGDFFASVPAGADAYLLSRVIHDWDDEAAIRILTTCRRAMDERGTLLLVEAVLPERAADNPAAIRMDPHMLVLLSGRERTAAEFARLLSVAGFRLTRLVPTGSPTGIAIVEAVPSP